uniref:Putative fasciclin-like arabinogalactan protein 7 n=2 Tax=Davidia involucrata TaxID=16924 RepID=A0A5B7ATX0_DAVIN
MGFESCRNLESVHYINIKFVKEKMEYTMIFMVSTTLVLLCSTSAYAQTVGSPALTPTPAPAPAPDFVNLTDLLTVAGPFHTFLGYLQSTKVIETFQNQANNTKEGITIFVPKDEAFSSLKKPSLSNLTGDQLKSLCLFHALSHYYSLADFKNLSQLSPVGTLAGGQYTLNFTDVSGTAHLSSGWTNTKVSSSIHSTDPVAVYQVDKVLLPEAIFGTDIPPTPAPAPSPGIAPAADTPSEDSGSGSSSPASSPPSSSYRIISSGMSHLLLAISGGLVLLL